MNKCQECEYCPSDYIPVKKIEYLLFQKCRNDLSSVNSKKGSAWQKYKYILGFLEFIKNGDPIYYAGLEDSYKAYSEEDREKIFKESQLGIGNNTVNPRISRIIQKLEEANEEDIKLVEEILGVSSLNNSGNNKDSEDISVEDDFDIV